MRYRIDVRDAQERRDGELMQAVRELETVRERRDALIREHPGTLREIAALTGLSYQRIQQIKTERNQR